MTKSDCGFGLLKYSSGADILFGLDMPSALPISQGFRESSSADSSLVLLMLYGDNLMVKQDYSAESIIWSVSSVFTPCENLFHDLYPDNYRNKDE